MDQQPVIPLVLADWGAVVWIVAFLILSVLRALAGDGEKKAQRRVPRRQGAGADAPGGDAPPPAGRQRELRSEVDEFLRRVKQHQAPETPQRAEPEPQPRRIEMLATEDAVRESSRGRGGEPSLGPDVRRGESVAEHVQQHVRHLEESQLAEHAALMGSQIATADDRVAARVKETFGREIGTLARRKEEAPPPSVDPVGASLNAEGIAAMLASPEGARNAIILSEILNRPADRF